MADEVIISMQLFNTDEFLFGNVRVLWIRLDREVRKFDRLELKYTELKPVTGTAAEPLPATPYRILRVFFSTIFRQFRQVNCRNRELDENFG